MRLIANLLAIIQALASDRARLAMENVLLRQQLAVLRRSTKRPRLEDSDRVFWILVRRLFKGWKDHLVIVKPETVVRWHRKGFQYYWRRKSRGTPGRPPISMAVIHLIRRMSLENVLWGAPRIKSELALVGHEVAESTVAKYMVKRENREPSQGWRTFLANHLNVSAACDFFTQSTLTFKVLYVFVVLAHDRRRIVHVNVTRHPTAAWAAQQIAEAFPGGQEPRYLHRDRDGTYGDLFRRRIAAMGIQQVVSAKQSPWQNPFVERVVGTIRRECTDHLIPWGERHLLQVLRRYAVYYNRSRCHLSLGRNAPEPRVVEDGTGNVRAIAHLGGLHHRYTRAA
ncbi:MAG: integrase core domain-containing protein [Planctomycetota bacterium]|jgi:transposase InsO family protein